MSYLDFIGYAVVTALALFFILGVLTSAVALVRWMRGDL